MKKKIGLGILTVILLISASSVFLIQKQSLTEHQKAWISDLEGPFKEVLASSAGINENMTEEERNRRIDEIIEAIRTKHWDDERIGYAVKELISDFQIAHMQFILCDEYAAQSEYYPIIGKWYGDEYRITETTPEYEQYIGYAIRKINNLDMSEVLKRYDTIIPNETQMWLKYSWEYTAKRAGGMRQLDLEYLDIVSKRSDDLELLLEKEGDSVIVAVAPVAIEDGMEYYSLLDQLQELPMYEKVYWKSGEGPFCYELDEQNRAFYFQYNECVDASTAGEDSGYPYFDAFFDEMIEQMKENSDKYDCFVVDLRGNSGGSSILIDDAISKHWDELATQKIKLLIGKATFSAAVDAIDSFLLAGFDDVTLYGEETGLAIHNYTDVSGSILPNTGNIVGIVDHEDWFGAINERASDLSRGVMPDVEVMQNYDDYVNGIDDVYMKAVEN